jgi:hypothetical protein
VSGYRATGGMASRAVKTEHEGQHMDPEPEKVVGTVFPYRGVENHGVAPNQAPPAYIDDQWPEDTEEPHYVQGPTEEDPLPVKIVQESSNERMMFRTNQMPVFADQPTPILSRQDSRRNVTIRLPSLSNSIWIGPDENVNRVTGYQLEADRELTLRTTEEVWAIGDGTNQSTALVIWEYAVPV